MTPKIFITWATGYLGGDVLYLLLKTHSLLTSSITCLVRSPSRGESLITAYPTIKIVTGTLEDEDLLEEEAAKADIILHFASSDHVRAAQAIKKGLERSTGGIWIHTSGTDILIPDGEEEGVRKNVKTFDDWENIKELFAFPDSNSHRPVDKLVQLTTSAKVKTAIICPPTIWGVGRGTGNTRSIQIYNLASLILSRGLAINIPSATPEQLFWPNIHIYDLSQLYLPIIESAIDEIGGKSGNATWDKEGYYFAENGKHYWNEVAGWIVEEASEQGYVQSKEVREVKREDLSFVGVALWNDGYSCKSIRGEKLFKWKPTQGELKDEIPRIVKSEAERLGIKN